MFAENTCAGRLRYARDPAVGSAQMRAHVTLTDRFPVDFKVVHQQCVSETHCIVHDGRSDRTTVCEAFVVHKRVGTNENYLSADANLQ